MFSKRKGSSVVHNLFFESRIHVEKLIHHHKGFLVCHNRGVRIYLHEIHNVRGMIRLHMLDHQVIRLSVPQHLCKIIQPLMREVNVHGVHNRNLLIHDDIGVVSHTVRYDILSLKKVHLVVIDPHISDVVCYSHFILLLFGLSGIHFLLPIKESTVLPQSRSRHFLPVSCSRPSWQLPERHAGIRTEAGARHPPARLSPSAPPPESLPLL